MTLAQLISLANANDEFTATLSSNEVFFCASTDDRLTDVLADIATEILARAEIDHTHTGFSLIDHVHTEYADADHTHTGYAASSHTHTPASIGAAASSHTHEIANISGLLAQLTEMLADIDGKAEENHTHTAASVGAASADHTHTGYAASGHTHDYADSEHTHTPASIGAAPANHSHSGYASVDHAHTGFAASDHTHDIDDVNGLATALNGKETSGAAASALTQANSYTDAAIAELISSAPSTLDTIGEIAAAMAENYDIVESLELAIGSKAPANHTHTPASIGAATADHTHTAASVGAAASNHTHTPAAIGAAPASHGHSYNDLSDKPASLPANGGNADTVDGKHASDFATATHTHDYSASNHTHTPESVGAAPANHTHNYAAAGHSHSYNTLTDLPTSLPANGGNADTVDGKHASDFATASHIHPTIPVTTADEDLDNYRTAGIYSFAAPYQPVNRPAGTSNGWLVVIPWNANTATGTVKQIWLRHGTLGTNDHMIYVRTLIGGTWGEWASIYTSKNPPTAAEVGAATSNHNHDDDYMDKALQFTADNGGMEKTFYTSNNTNLITELTALGMGFHTVYSQAGVPGNPNTTESWRCLLHKASSNIMWVMAFGSSGSIYTNYLNGTVGWHGWRCIYDANPAALWTGANLMTASQTVTPSKKLSECRTGWILMWSDYDESTGTANINDVVTSVIYKKSIGGTNWGGAAHYFDVPSYMGADSATDTSGERRVIKRLYVHDDKLIGHASNDLGERKDVVLRAIYEF